MMRPPTCWAATWQPWAVTFQPAPLPSTWQMCTRLSGGRSVLSPAASVCCRRRCRWLWVVLCTSHTQLCPLPATPCACPSFSASSLPPWPVTRTSMTPRLLGGVLRSPSLWPALNGGLQPRQIPLQSFQRARCTPLWPASMPLLVSHPRTLMSMRQPLCPMGPLGRLSLLPSGAEPLYGALLGRCQGLPPSRAPPALLSAAAAAASPTANPGQPALQTLSWTSHAPPAATAGSSRNERPAACCCGCIPATRAAQP
jgi:hypothetical protein